MASSLRAGGGNGHVAQVRVMPRKRRAEGRVRDVEGVWWEVGEHRGRKQRPKVCWSAPEAVALQCSDRTDTEIAAARQISDNPVRRLRSQSRRDGLVASAGHHRKPKCWWKAPEGQAAIFSGRPGA